MRNVPELRFDGFVGEWEEHNLSEFISVYRGLTYSPKDITNNISDTFVIRSSNVKNNSIIDADNVYVNPSIVNTENVKNGDIILVVRNGSRSLIGKHAAITKDMPNTVIGAFMSGVRARTPDFINALFDTSKFDKNIRKNLGATINQITNKNISEMKFFFTDIEEQEKIGVLFKKLDALIEVQEGKVSKLEDFKKSMLQKMFPKKGDLVPEYRFDGFDVEWNLFKLNELQNMKVYQPQTITSEDLIDGGKFRVFGANDYIGYYNDYNHENSQVTICCRGASVGNVNYVESYTWITGNSMVLNVDENDKIDKNYLYYYLKNTRLDRFITGSGQPQITREGLSLLKIKLTDLEEQEKIGQFFKNLDSQIENEEKLLESYKNMKKSLLQKMFV